MNRACSRHLKHVLTYGHLGGLGGTRLARGTDRGRYTWNENDLVGEGVGGFTG
jgi:hypothetical protein